MTYSVSSHILALCSPFNNAAAVGSLARTDTSDQSSPIDHFHLTAHSARVGNRLGVSPRVSSGWLQWRSDRAGTAPAAIDRPQLITTPTILGLSGPCATPTNHARPRGRDANCEARQHMSFVTTHPEALTSAASDLQGINSAIDAANAAIAAPTAGIIPAAADEVSTLTATQFAAHAQLYQAVAAQATAIHDQFVAALATSAGSYASTEAANAATTG